MGNREIHNTTEKAIAFLYRSITGSAAVHVGLVVDSTGFESLEFIMEGGVISQGFPDALYVMELEDSDNGINFDSVKSDFIITEGVVIAESNKTISIGYIGKRRFVRPSIARVGAAFSATIDSIGITVIGADAHHIPAAPPKIL